MNVLRACRFSTFPQEPIRSGLLRELSGAAVKLYLFLLDHCQRYSCVAVELSDFQIEDHIGLSDKSARVARKQLETCDLISCSVCNSCHVIRYRLLNPDLKTGSTTARWLRLLGKDGDEKPDVVRHYRSGGRSARKVKAARRTMRDLQVRKKNETVFPPTWAEIEASPEREPGEDDASIQDTPI